MKALNRRILAMEAFEATRPMSKAEEEIIRHRLWAKIQIIGAGRELPACCTRQSSDQITPEHAASLSRLERMEANEDDDHAEFKPLPDVELDALEQFLIEGKRHDRA